jgi:archaellum biogenesis protein FlaJ (TadC family)
MIPLYVVMAGLFATLDGFFSSLASFISKVSTMVDFMATPPIDFMRFFFMFTLALFALNNVFSIYNMEGDSRFTMMYYLGMQLTLGGIFYLAIFGAVSGYLGNFAMPM